MSEDLLFRTDTGMMTAALERDGVNNGASGISGYKPTGQSSMLLM